MNSKQLICKIESIVCIKYEFFRKIKPFYNEDNLNEAVVNNETISSNNSDGLDSDACVHGHGNTSNTLDLKDLSSDNDNVVVVANNEPNWAELPSLAVERIYTFLSRTDQSRMSQVCSSWANDFESPSLWNRMTFILKGREDSLEIYPEVKFARKYGYMFRHVQIIITEWDSHKGDVIWTQLKLFLQALTSLSQLNSFTFNQTRCFRLFPFHEILLDFYQTITNFFNSQENLQSVTFRDSPHNIIQWSKLLKAVFHSDLSNIKDVKFHGTNSTLWTSDNYILADLLEVCDRIMKVQTLEFDYSKIFVDLIKCLHQKMMKEGYHPDNHYPSLSTLTIFYENQGRSVFEGIPSNIWKYLSNAFPCLKVKIFFYLRSYIMSNVNEIFVKHMPLEALDIVFSCFSDTLIEDIMHLFRHLSFCLYQDHLKVFNIVWIPSNADFEGTVIPFVKSCRKLRDLYFYIKHQPVRIENILNALFLNHPKSMKFIRISFCYYGIEEIQSNYIALSEQYFQLFNAKGIKCFLDVLSTFPRPKPERLIETVS